MLVSGLLALALGVTAVSLPVPYVVESPGPTFNTLGSDNGKPVISVSGHETFPAKGNLDLTTVYVDGGPNGPVTVVEALSAWLSGAKAVYPEELVFPTGVTKEQSQQESAVAMTTSQENAVASALKELGIPFEQKMQVAGIPEGSASAGKLQENDVLVSVNGKPATALSVVQAELAAGNGAPVDVVVERDGSNVTANITPSKTPAGRFILGVMLQYQFKFPFDVKISLEKVGGPSAGMMFALGIVDTVTPRRYDRRQACGGNRNHHPRRSRWPDRRHQPEDARRAVRRRHHVPCTGRKLRRRRRAYPGRAAGGPGRDPGGRADGR